MDYPITCFSMEKGYIKLVQTSLNSFTVIYGRQVRKHLTYVNAARELGECIMHNAACESRLDNRDWNEIEDTDEID